MTAPRSGSRVVIDGLEKYFDERAVLRGIDLDIPPGEFLTVVGRSGCGKSTLLRVLCGLTAASSGSARILDAAGAEARAKVRVVFQEPRLLPWKTVLDNVCVGMRREDLERARDVLAAVGLADRASEYPAVLSGGERQRVALARAVVHEPGVLLLDEPFGALDALTRIEAQRLVERLWLERRFTAVLVTHDVGEAVLLGGRVLVMEAGSIAASFAVDVPRPRRREHADVAHTTGAVLDAILSGAQRDSAQVSGVHSVTHAVGAAASTLSLAHFKERTIA